MANISVTTTELLQVLEATPAKHNVLLIGNHGIGKSEILTEFYEQKGMKVISLLLSQFDVGDLIGLPHKNEQTGKTEFMPPYWFPTDGKPIVLFLDEINRARPEVLASIFDLCLNRKLAGKALPEGSRVIAAVNDGERYSLTDMDPALISRWNTLVFRPTVQEWLLWGKKNELDPRVLDFIQENQIWLDKDPDAKEDADTGLDKGPDRRSWARVSDIIKGVNELSPIYTKLVASVVGPKAASVFISSVANKKLVSGRDVIFRFDKVRKELEGYQLHQLSTVNDSLYRCLEVEKINPADKDTAKKNIEAYFDFLTKNKKEAAAHFSSLYTQKTYPVAVTFLAKECPVLVMSMIIYVKGI